MTKTRAQIKHALMRAKERYNLNLTLQEYFAIRNKILRNESEPIKRKSNRASIHKVLYRDIELKVAYDTTRHTIVTFLR